MSLLFIKNFQLSDFSPYIIKIEVQMQAVKLLRPGNRLIRRYFNTFYDGTVSSLAYADTSEHALVKDIETVPLAFDRHQSPATAIDPPLLFLHGLFGSKANNRSISRQLAKKLNRDVYCLDLRNHGDSPHNQRHDYPAMAADVERFITEHEVKRPVVIGHSMGAKAAMALVLRNKDICSGLISVDNAPIDFTFGRGTGFSKFGEYVRQLKRIEQNTHLKSLKECDMVLAAVEPSLPIRQFLLTNLKKRDSSGYYCRVPLDIIGPQLDNVSGWPFNHITSRWNGDTLFIRGTKSGYIADEFLASLGLFFPRFILEDINAGHWVTSEKPHESIDAIVRFLDRLEDDVLSI